MQASHIKYEQSFVKVGPYSLYVTVGINTLKNYVSIF